MDPQVQAQKGQVVTLANRGKLLLEKSQGKTVLEPKSDCDGNIFWHLLRDHVAGKIAMERTEQDGKTYVKFGEILFDTSGTVTLFQEKDGIRELNVEDVIFYCNVLHSPTYFAYMKKVTEEKKTALRRGDV
ncbi:unnamed protein product [Gongylonema pulchrum]|uniref:BPL_C domain-containing protein n=1 Tax=Gongylonema pulchrum TaxID=637853 RepID=A0A183DWD3_9BILA|nr:unnamed protein product [Gongylonema pulchrum]